MTSTGETDEARSLVDRDAPAYFEQGKDGAELRCTTYDSENLASTEEESRELKE